MNSRINGERWYILYKPRTYLLADTYMYMVSIIQLIQNGGIIELKLKLSYVQPFVHIYTLYVHSVHVYLVWQIAHCV